MTSTATNLSDAPADTPARRWMDFATLYAVAAFLVGTAAAWYLLKELAPLLRPLFLAVFLAYVIMPVRLALQRRSRGAASFVVLAIVALSFLFGVALLIYSNVVEFNRELQPLIDRSHQIFNNLREYVETRMPAGADVTSGTSQMEERFAEAIKDSVASVANVTVGVVLELLEIAFYLVFLLFEAGHFSERIRGSFPGSRAEQILTVVGQINQAMTSFLVVKVKASLVLAVPAAILLWVLGVKFAFLWGVLFFFGNFIPYFGSIAVWLLASAFAFVQLDFGWRPVVVAVSLLALRTLATDLLEPAITGKAVNLSPLVILASLSFWSLCWGLTGMLLAVPLTVMFKIILENVTPARPVAKMMTEVS
jgi:predicted PurR-regulated permease PerM